MDFSSSAVPVICGFFGLGEEPCRPKIPANGANDQHSTGPRTVEGQAVSSQNSFRHSLAGTFRVLATEDAAAFELLLEGLREEHTPQSATEDILVDGLAQHHWLAQRALRLQDELFAASDLADPRCPKAAGALHPLTKPPTNAPFTSVWQN